MPMTRWLLVGCALAGGLSPALAGGREDGAVATSPAELTNALSRGGVIRVAPGVYEGNFVISVAGTTVVGVPDLPEVRVSPEDVAGVVLAQKDPAKAALTVMASRVRVTGLTVRLRAADRAAIVVGSFKAAREDEQPDRVTLDRLAVLAAEQGGLRGVVLHGSHLTLTRSYVAGFRYGERDSRAVWGVNGPGPYTIDDNYLEASGQNVMIGGARIRIPNCVPSDINVTRNTIMKPPESREHRGSVKSALEFRAGRRILVQGNTIDGNWRDAQSGDTILLTPRNEERATPWVVVEDVVIRANTIRHDPDGYAINILGADTSAPTGQTARVTIEGNLFADSRNGVRVIGYVADALVISRNTFPAIKGNLLSFSGKGQTPLTFTNNVGRSGSFGISGESAGIGVRALGKFTKLVAFTDNVIERSARREIPWPDGNTLLDPGELKARLNPATLQYSKGTAGY
jgi:hypothetical protein